MSTYNFVQLRVVLQFMLKRAVCLLQFSYSYLAVRLNHFIGALLHKHKKQIIESWSLNKNTLQNVILLKNLEQQQHKSLDKYYCLLLYERQWLTHRKDFNGAIIITYWNEKVLHPRPSLRSPFLRCEEDQHRAQPFRFQDDLNLQMT